jgi:hypothetical protein
MCDETASSRIAPPPVLPIKDVKLEAASPCENAPPSAAPVAVRPVETKAPSGPAAALDSVATEAWVRTSEIQLIAPFAGIRRLILEATAPMTPGFHPSVFRPPRG